MLGEASLKQCLDMIFAPGGDGVIPGGDHANLSLAWNKSCLPGITVHVRSLLQASYAVVMNNILSTEYTWNLNTLRNSPISPWGHACRSSRTSCTGTIREKFSNTIDFMCEDVMNLSSNKLFMYDYIFSFCCMVFSSMPIYLQLRVRRALLQFKDVPLRTIPRALSLYKVYGNCALLVLNRTSLHCNWRYVLLRIFCIWWYITALYVCDVEHAK